MRRFEERLYGEIGVAPAQIMSAPPETKEKRVIEQNLV